jgi:pyruvate/2-oxoglutarate dehydrogenase complex dihydrolipoamide dehydrogenase (E3) component
MSLIQGRGVGCVHNPAVGHEAVLGSGTLKLAATPRRIVVVGGGPAGMAAARVAAERGHQVTLYERDGELGGQNRMTARIASRKTYAETTRWLAHRLGRAGVDVQLGRAVSSGDILDAGADAVVIATGSTPRRTGYSSHRPHVARLPGVELPHVVTVWDVFSNEAEIGERVVLIDEDPHFAGIFSAEHLADLGRRVEVVTPGLHVGRTLEIGFVPHLYRRILPKGVVVTPDTIVTGIEVNAVTCETRYTGEALRIENVDTVVLAMGNETDDGLYRELKGRVPELHTVGDCVAPRNMADAIFDGERVGRLI